MPAMPHIIYDDSATKEEELSVDTATNPIHITTMPYDAGRWLATGSPP
jgi:hypothetical protein